MRLILMSLTILLTRFIADTAAESVDAVALECVPFRAKGTDALVLTGRGLTWVVWKDNDTRLNAQYQKQGISHCYIQIEMIPNNMKR